MVIFTNYCLFLKFTVVVFFVFDYNRQENIFEAIQRYHCIRMEDKMEIVCLDLEGVLVPEIWIAFAEETGIPELKKTTRDEPDYDKLMKYRLNILKEHNLGLKEIQETIAKIDPLPGAKEFLDKEEEEHEGLYCSRGLLSLCGRRRFRLDQQHDQVISKY